MGRLCIGLIGGLFADDVWRRTAEASAAAAAAASALAAEASEAVVAMRALLLRPEAAAAEAAAAAAASAEEVKGKVFSGTAGSKKGGGVDISIKEHGGVWDWWDFLR